MSDRVVFQFTSSQSGWKSVAHLRTGGSEAHVAKTVMSFWHQQRSHVDGMGDRIGVQLPVWEIYLSLTNYLGQLSHLSCWGRPSINE